MKCFQGGHESEIFLHIAGKFISDTVIVCIRVSTTPLFLAKSPLN